MDFPRAIISINAYSDKWGPFEFDLEPALPESDALTAVTVGSYLREGGTDTTSYLIESGTTQISGSTVSVRLQYPGSTRTGEHLLKFDVTLTSGAKHRLVFGSVMVSWGG